MMHRSTSGCTAIIFNTALSDAIAVNQGATLERLRCYHMDDWMQRILSGRKALDMNAHLVRVKLFSTTLSAMISTTKVG